MTEWTISQVCEAASLQRLYVITDVRSNRIVVRRLRRQKENLHACEQRLFAVPKGVTKADKGTMLLEDDRKYLFKLVPQENTPLKNAIDALFAKGKI